MKKHEKQVRKLKNGDLVCFYNDKIEIINEIIFDNLRGDIRATEGNRVTINGQHCNIGDVTIISSNKKYSIKEILYAARLGEVSMIDAEHIVSLLPEARAVLKSLSLSIKEKGGAYQVLKKGSVIKEGTYLECLKFISWNNTQQHHKTEGTSSEQ